MPEKGRLVQTSLASENNQRSHEGILGAYWINQSDQVKFEDIKLSIQEIKKNLLSEKQIAALSHNDEFKYFDTMETDLMHVGHMISVYSDSQIPNLDARLQKIQSLGSDYENNILSGDETFDRWKAWRQINDLSLSLGTEVRLNLIDNLKKVRDFGNPLRIPLTDESSPEAKPLLQDASKYFPSQWNKSMSFPLELVRSKDSNFSSYSGDEKKEMFIGNHRDRIHTASSLSDLASKTSNEDESFLTKASFVHELSHYYEENSQTVIGVSNRFLARRGKIIENKEDLEGPGYVYEDHFASRYTGRYYLDGAKGSGELFSTGMEATFVGSNGSLIGLSLPLTKDEGEALVHFNPDPEHRNLTIGFLATIDLANEKESIFRFLPTFK